MALAATMPIVIYTLIDPRIRFGRSSHEPRDLRRAPGCKASATPDLRRRRAETIVGDNPETADDDENNGDLAD
jgi:hypothetical protein